VVPLSAVLVLIWARWTNTPWRDLGFIAPKKWMATLIVSVVFGAAFKLLLKAIVMPLLGAEPINQPFHYLVANPDAVPGILYAVIVGAGFGEETLFRCFMFERLGKLFGSGLPAKAWIVLLSAGLFGLAHYPVQGLAGVEQAMIVGVVFGICFTVRRQIWMLMFAHAAFDVTAVAIIYWDLESTVAHLVFK
jgi:membrane protease YdiL (CAAX protease family)